MKFSILIANYNNASFLGEAIQSALVQTHSDVEVLIYDDGSTDDSISLIKKYASQDKRIKYFLNKENLGQGYAKSTLLQHATGVLAGFLDSDDAITTNAVEEMVLAYNLRPEASLIYSQCYLCDSNLKIKRIWEIAKPLDSEKDYLHTVDYRVFPFCAFPMSKYNLTEGLLSSDKRAMDQDLYYKLEEVGTLVFISKPLYYYRRHENNLTNPQSTLKSMIWHLKYIENACKRRGIPEDYYEIAFQLIRNREMGFVNKINNYENTYYFIFLLKLKKIRKNILLSRKWIQNRLGF